MTTHPSPAGLPSLTTYSQVRRASDFVQTGYPDECSHIARELPTVRDADYSAMCSGSQ